MKKILLLVLLMVFMGVGGVLAAEKDDYKYGSSAVKESSVQYLKKSVEQQKEIIQLLKEIKQVLKENQNK